MVEVERKQRDNELKRSQPHVPCRSLEWGRGWRRSRRALILYRANAAEEKCRSSVGDDLDTRTTTHDDPAALDSVATRILAMLDSTMDSTRLPCATERAILHYTADERARKRPP